MECDRTPYERVRVYQGQPLKGNITDNALVYNDGKVYSDNYCYDTAEIWCNSMIEDIGPPLYIMTERYNRDSNAMTNIKKCQEMMDNISGYKTD